MRIVIILTAITLSACTALREKGENYERAASMAVNPERIRIIYEREGGNASFMEMRCTGGLCPAEE